MHRRLLSLATTAFGLVGVSAPVLADETTVVDLPHLESATVTYAAFDPQHVLINENAIVQSIAQELTGATRFPMHSEQDTKDAVNETGGRTQADVVHHTLIIWYQAVSRYLSGGETGTKLKIPVNYTISRTDDQLTVTYSFPENAKSYRHGMPFLTRKLWATNTILEDYSQLTAKLVGLPLKLTYNATGELESRYKQDAVLGNLERMLGRPGGGALAGAQIGGSGSVTREADFVYTDKGVRRTVHVSTVPYHDGSKVLYRANLPYTLKPDGSVEGTAGPPALNDLLSKVIND